MRWALAALVFAAGGAAAQEAAQGPDAQPAQVVQAKNSVTLFANLGYELNVSAFGAPISGLDRTGPAASVRVMIHPKFLLSFGWEVGYTRRYSVKQTGDSSIDATSSSYPVLLVLSMSPVRRLLVNVGLGPVFSTTSVTALGVEAKSYTGFRTGFMASAAYLLPVANRWDMGAELRFLRAEQFSDDLVSLQLSVAYRLSGK